MVREMNAWFVRAGEGGRYADQFVAAGVAALGWAVVSELRDLRGLDLSEVVGLIEDSGAITQPARDAAELLIFRDDLARGDLVVTPDSPRRDFLFGTVDGDYEYRDPSPVGDYRHV